MTEQEQTKLDLVWRGVRCVVCQFPFGDVELDDMTEGEFGWQHISCGELLDEDEEELSEEK